MEPQEQGQPLLRKDDFSEEVISQILKKGTNNNNREKEKTQREVKVVTHLIHVNCKADSAAAAEDLFGPPIKSCKVCGDMVEGHYVVTKHSFVEPSTNPYMCGICGEAFPQGYLLKIHLEVEHGFVEKDSNRRSLRLRNKSHDGIRPIGRDGGRRKGKRDDDSNGLQSKTDFDQEDGNVVPGVKGHPAGELDININQDKENNERGKMLRTTPDKTILLTSNGSDNLTVENDVDGVSEEDGEVHKGLEKTNNYKSGDLIVINLFTEGGGLPPSKRSRRSSQQKSNKTEGEDKYRCEFCEMGFRSQQKRGMHIKESHPNCKLKCHQCSAEFSERRLMNIHVKSHQKVRPPPKPKEVKKRVPPVCKLCNKTFLHESGLQIHTQNFHPELVKGQKSFCCEKCGAMFWTHTAMVEHQRIHLDKKPFVCSYCKKGFCRRSDLKSHVKVHTGEKPFKCSHCDKAFRQRLQMVNHVRTHTGEKPYKCEFCEKAFVKRDQYTRHRRVHTKERPYKCGHCDKFFKSRSNLNDHERVHTGVKPFKCSHCDKAFAQYTNLVHHVRIHTGHKPYVCPQCQKPFPRSNSLKAHMKSHKKIPENSRSVSDPPMQDSRHRTIQMPLQQQQQQQPQQHPLHQHQQQLHQLQPLQTLPVYHPQQQHPTASSVIANVANELLASMQVSIVTALDDVAQHDIGGRYCPPVDSLVAQASVTNMIAGGPVTPVASFIPNGTINGFGASENEAAAACESIVVLANMNDYQPLPVTHNLGSFQ